MLVDASNTGAATAVTAAIRQAAQATGTSFNYLLATAQVESGFNALAGAASSSAKGLFQFIQQTWFATMKQAGPALGYGRYADAISMNSAGQYQVSDPAMRNEILSLRSDPAANAAMAGAFTQANATLMSQRLGRAPTDGELYIAHFLGAGGALRLIDLAASDPTAKAADIFSGAAQANRSIFYDRNGSARSVAQVRNVLIGRYDVARGSTSQTAAAQAPAARAGTATTTAAATPDTAGVADAFAAAIPTPAPNDHQVFHGLFADARTGPVAPVVSALWGGRSDGNAPAQSRANVGWADLFRDPVKGS